MARIMSVGQTQTLVLVKYQGSPGLLHVLEAKQWSGSGENFRQGKDVDAKLVLKLIGNSLLPQDLEHTKASLEGMLRFVDESSA